MPNFAGGASAPRAGVPGFDGERVAELGRKLSEIRAPAWVGKGLRSAPGIGARGAGRFLRFVFGIPGLVLGVMFNIVAHTMSPFGRSGRLWFLFVGWSPVFLAVTILALRAERPDLLPEYFRAGFEEDAKGVLLPYLIAYVWASFAVTCRRLHDVGMSAWWNLIGIIPFAGQALVIYLIFKRGNENVNEWGWPPSVFSRR